MAQSQASQSQNSSQNSSVRNVVIIGAGISGLTSAIYTARANLKPLIICGPEDGGQLTQTTEVENFPGFEHGVQGPELVANTKKQAQRFGAEFLTGYVKSITKNAQNQNANQDAHAPFQITMQDGSLIQSYTVIIATGATAKWLGIQSEKAYKGRGVSACATCDGFFFRNKEVLVIGGGDSAMEEATFLTKFASKVTVVHRKDVLRASKIMQEKFFNTPKTAVIWNNEIDEILGDGKKVTGARLKNTATGELSQVKCDGIFLAIGHVPNTGFLGDLVELDPVGYIKTDRYTHTKTPGLYASGDVQDNKWRQAITAAGTGCAAALEAERFLAANGLH